MGIWIAAGLTTLLAIALLQWPIRRLSDPADRTTLLLAASLALPLSPLAFHLVRTPLHQALEAGLGPGVLLLAISLLYAPITEEPAKWLVLALPRLRRALRPDNAIAMALAIGLGFGVGEIWFLATLVSGAPAVAELPFWMFGGFLVERLQVAFLHGAFIAWFLRALAAGRAPWWGGAIGVALHFLVNLPVVLIGLDPFGLGAAVWTQIVSLWLVVVMLGLLAAMRRLARGDRPIDAFGTRICPGCTGTYPRPIIMALNLGTTRIERCPHCRRWHRMPAGLQAS